MRDYKVILFFKKRLEIAHSTYVLAEGQTFG